MVASDCRLAAFLNAPPWSSQKLGVFSDLLGSQNFASGFSEVWLVGKKTWFSICFRAFCGVLRTFCLASEKLAAKPDFRGSENPARGFSELCGVF